MQNDMTNETVIKSIDRARRLEVSVLASGAKGFGFDPSRVSLET